MAFEDHTGIDHSQFSFGLKKSLFNFMNGVGFDMHLQEWFDFKIPKTTIPKHYIEDCLESSDQFKIKPNAKIVWLGGMPFVSEFTKKKRGTLRHYLQMDFHTQQNFVEVSIDKDQGEWLLDKLDELSPENKPKTYTSLKRDFETQFEDFELFWFSKPMLTPRNHGLLVL